jgi:hypothetical protein
MDTFNRSLDEIIPHSFVSSGIYNEFITLSILRYRYDISNQINSQSGISKAEQKRQIIELSRKTTFFCTEVGKCNYDKIDIFDQISKDQIINGIISYFNELITNSQFYIENIKNETETSFGGRENEYMLFSYSKFPQLYLNTNIVAFITGTNNLSTLFNSYISNYDELYEHLIKKSSFNGKTTNDIKEMFENNNLSKDNIILIIDGIIEFTNINIVVTLNNGSFLINKLISIDKSTLFVYAKLNTDTPNYWSIIKSLNLNDKSVSNYTINDHKAQIINKMIDNSFNRESLSIIPSDDDFTEPLKKIEINVYGKKVILLIGKTGILYKPVTNEILGLIEIINGEIITDTVGVCNIQWVNGYNELL